jgi:hypothetical protein
MALSIHPTGSQSYQGDPRLRLDGERREWKKEDEGFKFFPFRNFQEYVALATRLCFCRSKVLAATTRINAKCYGSI